MKRILLVLMLLIFLTGCKEGLSEQSLKDELIADFNKNSNFELELASDVTNDIKNQFTIRYDFGSYSMFDLDIFEDDESSISYNISDFETTMYSVGGYPDVISNTSKIIYIATSDPSINVYGLSVGQVISIDDIVDIIVEHNFTKTDNIGVGGVTFQNKAIRLSISVEDGVIREIRVAAITTNNDGVVF